MFPVLVVHGFILAFTSCLVMYILYQFFLKIFEFQLPAIRPHKKLLLRLLVAVRRRSDNGVCVLVSEKTAAHLPVCEINPTRSIHSTLKKYMTEIFGSDLPPHRRKS